MGGNPHRRAPAALPPNARAATDAARLSRPWRLWSGRSGGRPAAGDLAHTFQALADPTRVRLVSALSSTELCVSDLAAVLGMTQSAVSHQLRTLRDLRLVKSRRSGREIFYTLDDDHIRQLFQLGLSHIQHH